MTSPIITCVMWCTLRNKLRKTKITKLEVIEFKLSLALLFKSLHCWTEIFYAAKVSCLVKGSYLILNAFNVVVNTVGRDNLEKNKTLWHKFVAQASVTILRWARKCLFLIKIALINNNIKGTHGSDLITSLTGLTAYIVFKKTFFPIQEERERRRENNIFLHTFESGWASPCHCFRWFSRESIRSPGFVCEELHKIKGRMCCFLLFYLELKRNFNEKSQRHNIWDSSFSSSSSSTLFAIFSRFCCLFVPPPSFILFFWKMLSSLSSDLCSDLLNRANTARKRKRGWAEKALGLNILAP